MLVNPDLYPVADLKVFQTSTHRAQCARLAHFDVGFRRERHGDLAAILEPDDGKALGRIESANLTVDQQPHPPPR